MCAPKQLTLGSRLALLAAASSAAANIICSARIFNVVAITWMIRIYSTAHVYAVSLSLALALLNSCCTRNHIHTSRGTWCFYVGTIWSNNNETSYTKRKRHLNATCSAQLLKKNNNFYGISNLRSRAHIHRRRTTRRNNERREKNKEWGANECTRIIKEIIHTRKSKEENGKKQIHNS